MGRGNNKIVISDTTAIIYLSRLRALHLLESLFQVIYIPEAVYQELIRKGDHIPGAIEVKTYPWIKTEPVKNLAKVMQGFGRPLHAGESEAIALALEKNADLLIIDEKDGRWEARQQGIRITGMLGIFLLAKERGLIRSVRPYLDRLVLTTNFKLNPKLYHDVLMAAGESKAGSQ
ncbi:MAG: DUF3368 domain-containing protein [Pseudomonadales bacterium]|nr:DUF3368 domain-containing protein [Pseudomonadales bacterium]